MKMKKLESKKLEGPKKRSVEAYAMILRGGAGSGHHGDKSKYTRKPKHKKRYNPEGGELPTPKQQERVRNSIRDDVSVLLGQLNQQLIRSPSTSGVAFQPADLARLREELISFLTKAHFSFFDKQTDPEGESIEVIQKAMGLKEGGPYAALGRNATAMKMIQPQLTKLSLLLEAARDTAHPAEKVSTDDDEDETEEVEIESDEDEDEDEDESKEYSDRTRLLYDEIQPKLEAAGLRLSLREFVLKAAEGAGDDATPKEIFAAARELAQELIKEAKKSKAEAPKPSKPKPSKPEAPKPSASKKTTIGGVEIDPEIMKKVAAAEDEDEDEDEEEESTPAPRPRTPSGHVAAGDLVSRLKAGKVRGELSAEPYMQYAATRRGSERPPAAMQEQTKKDILLYVLPDRTTQVYVKGSCTHTFNPPGQGRSSVQIALKYADAWRRTGGSEGGMKKSRAATRIFAAVHGDDRLLLKSEALQPATGETVSPMSYEELGKILKVEGVKSNPGIYGELYKQGFRFVHRNRRRNGALATIGAFAAGAVAGIASQRVFNVTGRAYSQVEKGAARIDEQINEHARKTFEKQQAAREKAGASHKAKLQAAAARDKGYRPPEPWTKVSIGDGQYKWIRTKKEVVGSWPVTVYTPDEGEPYYAVWLDAFGKNNRPHAVEYSLRDAIETANRMATKSNPRHAAKGKYADVLEYHGKKGFGVPSKAPGVGSFPLYPIQRARYALAVVAAPTYDSKPAIREKVIEAALKAWPILHSEAKHVRETVRKREQARFRRVANPKHRK
jgi:hypothetical protein